MEKIKAASVLAFDRKLLNSDALMYSGHWEERTGPGSWRPIAIQEKSVRGTISNRMKSALAQDPAKLDADISKPNLQTVDYAALPFDTDTLKVSFTLRVLGDLATPTACNEPTYQAILSEKVNGYIKTHGLTELARRYAANLANARFLWRNRVGAGEVEVQVSHGTDRWTFNSFDFSLRDFAASTDDLKALTAVIERGLAGDSSTLVKVDAFVRLGQGQEVFPSQELVMNRAKGDKSKVLYQVGGVAAIHSQKVGNALRTIDDWHPSFDEVGPIAVEPYGSVTNRGTAFRQPKEKMDFYNFFDNWMLKDQAPEVEQQHYVIATLIRGGVFGKAD